MPDLIDQWAKQWGRAEVAEDKVRALEEIMSPAKSIDPVDRVVQAQAVLWPSLDDFWAQAAKRPS